MAIFRNRFTSWSQVLAIYAACAFPIFIWTIPQIIGYASQWLLRLSLWDTLGVMAYLLANAVVESLLVFLVVMVLALILPVRVYDKVLVPLAAAFATITTIFVIVLIMTQERALLYGSLNMTFVSLAVYLVVLGLAYLVIRRNKRVATLINGLIDRLVPLVALYVFFGVLGVALVAMRNLA